MHKDLELVCTSLEALSNAVIGASTEARTLCEAYGWNCPTVTRHDLAALPKQLAERIREANPEEIDDALIPLVNDMPRRIQFMQANTIPYLFNGNAVNAAPAYIGTLDSMRQSLEPMLTWQINNDPKAMPPKIAKRLRALVAELDEIAPDKDALRQQIKLIQDAVEAAESLPTDLQALRDAHGKVTKISDDSILIMGKITPKEKEATDSVNAIKLKEVEAAKLVALCEEAYQITTTKGLAAAFDIRAKNLSDSMFVWVFGLIGALTVGAYLGAHSFDLLTNALSAKETKWDLILMNIMLAVLSVGAPVWFAWIATKQIGQRFRLAEDYAFKASVAKAYEGYRKEAVRIDPAFEARLFSSALTRLEEAPLRLVESETHGSPWHELFASKPFQNALETVPELKAKFIAVAKDGIDLVKTKTATPKVTKPDEPA